MMELATEIYVRMRPANGAIRQDTIVRFIVG